MEWGLLAASGSVAQVILTFLSWNLADSNICQRDCYSLHGKRLTFKSFYASMRVAVCRSRLQHFFLFSCYFLLSEIFFNVSKNAFSKSSENKLPRTVSYQWRNHFTILLSSLFRKAPSQGRLHEYDSNFHPIYTLNFTHLFLEDNVYKMYIYTNGYLRNDYVCMNE